MSIIQLITTKSNVDYMEINENGVVASKSCNDSMNGGHPLIGHSESNNTNRKNKVIVVPIDALICTF